MTEGTRSLLTGRLLMDAFVAMLDSELLELYRIPLRPGIVSDG